MLSMRRAGRLPNSKRGTHVYDQAREKDIDEHVNVFEEGELETSGWRGEIELLSVRVLPSICLFPHLDSIPSKLSIKYVRIARAHDFFYNNSGGPSGGFIVRFVLTPPRSYWL